MTCSCACPAVCTLACSLWPVSLHSVCPGLYLPGRSSPSLSWIVPLSDPLEVKPQTVQARVKAVSNSAVSDPPPAITTAAFLSGEGVTHTPGTQESTGVSRVDGVCYWDPYSNEPQSHFPSRRGWIKPASSGPSFLISGTDSWPFHGGGETTWCSRKRVGETGLCLHMGSTARSCTWCFFNQPRVFF